MVNNKKVNNLLILVTIVVLFILIGCNQVISIKGENEVFIDETIQLNVTGLIKTSYSWKSSDNEVATVDNGLITGLKAGKVTISIISNNDILSNHLVTVKSYVPEEIEIVGILDSYLVGTEYELKAIGYPEYSSQEFIWQASGARVDINKETGAITFLNQGDIHIMCTSKLNNTIFKHIMVKVQLPENTKETNILFLGNSLTYVNDIPKMVQDMAILSGKIVNCESITGGGYTLWNIYNNFKNEIESIFSQKQFDYLILQEQSYHNFLSYDNFLYFSKQLNEIASTYGVKVVLYQTWAYKENSITLKNLGLTQNEMHNLIVTSYDNVANEIDCKVNRVGEVFYAFLLENPDINLYIDDSHASLAGSYLSSCVHFVSLFNESIAYNSYEINLDDNVKRLIEIFVTNYLQLNN